MVWTDVDKQRAQSMSKLRKKVEELYKLRRSGLENPTFEVKKNFSQTMGGGVRSKSSFFFNSYKCYCLQIKCTHGTNSIASIDTIRNLNIM